MSRAPFLKPQDLDAVSRPGFEVEAEPPPLPPFMVKVGDPGHWRVVLVRNGEGFIFLNGQWQQLVTAPGFGGRVLTNSEARAFLAEHGEPKP